MSERALLTNDLMQHAGSRELRTVCTRTPGLGRKKDRAVIQTWIRRAKPEETYPTGHRQGEKVSRKTNVIIMAPPFHCSFACIPKHATKGKADLFIYLFIYLFYHITGMTRHITIILKNDSPCFTFRVFVLTLRTWARQRYCYHQSDCYHKYRH